jgi:hypothetical protein
LRIANKTNLSIAGKVKILKESFSGFREILLLGLEKKFYSQMWLSPPVKFNSEMYKLKRGQCVR